MQTYHTETFDYSVGIVCDKFRLSVSDFHTRDVYMIDISRDNTVFSGHCIIKDIDMLIRIISEYFEHKPNVSLTCNVISPSSLIDDKYCDFHLKITLDVYGVSDELHLKLLNALSDSDKLVNKIDVLVEQVDVLVEQVAKLTKELSDVKNENKVYIAGLYYTIEHPYSIWGDETDKKRYISGLQDYMKQLKH